MKKGLQGYKKIWKLQRLLGDSPTKASILNINMGLNGAVSHLPQVEIESAFGTIKMDGKKQ